RRDEERDRGDADAVADNDRLDEAADQLIAQHEQPEDRERDVPVRKDRQGEERRQRGAQDRADVRHEAHEARDDAPQQRVRDAEEQQAEGDERAEAEVQQGEREQIPADAFRGLADGLRRHGEVRAPGQTQHFVAQLLAVLQQEEDQDDDEEDRRDALDRRRELFVALAHVRLFDDAHRQRLFRRLRRLGGALESALEALEDGQAAGAAAEKGQPLLDAVHRRGLAELFGHGVELLVDPPSPQANPGDGNAERQHDGAGAAEEGALEDGDDRAEKEGEEDGQRHRDDDRFGQIQNSDGDDGDGENSPVRRLPPLLRGTLVDERGRLRHAAHGKRAIEIVGIVFVEGPHSAHGTARYVPWDKDVEVWARLAARPRQR